MKQRVLAAGVAAVMALAALVPYTVVASATASMAQPAQDPSETKLVEQVEFSGNRRIPDESMRLWVQMREAIMASKFNELFFIPDSGPLEIIVNRDEQKLIDRDRERFQKARGG